MTASPTVDDLDKQHVRPYAQSVTDQPFLNRVSHHARTTCPRRIRSTLLCSGTFELPRGVQNTLRPRATGVALGQTSANRAYRSMTSIIPSTFVCPMPIDVNRFNPNEPEILLTRLCSYCRKTASGVSPFIRMIIRELVN